VEVDRRAVLGGAGAGIVPRKGGRLSAQLLGAWTFVDAATVEGDGRETLWAPGSDLRGGLLIFAPGGYVSLQLAALPSYVAPPPETRGFATRWFGYFGRYRVDESARELVLEIAGSFVLAEMTSNRPRKIELVGDILSITKPPPATGERRSNRLRWKRASASA
jgi:hypothetical protein